jgi:hypothetical protein
MTLSLTLTQPGSILISGGATVVSVNGGLGSATCQVGLPTGNVIAADGPEVGNPFLEGPLFQGGRFSGLSAGTYTITWSCIGQVGTGSPGIAIEHLSLNAWASQ